MIYKRKKSNSSLASVLKGFMRACTPTTTYISRTKNTNIYRSDFENLKLDWKQTASYLNNGIKRFSRQ